MMARNVRAVLLVALTALLISIGIAVSSCSENPPTQAKTSSLLLLQVNLRKEQLASPTPERLAQMQAQGMNTTNINIQRIYIYMKQPLTPPQASELQELGITVYLNSWIRPAGNNPDGFYLADMPVDKLDALAAKDYVVRLDTAERLIKPQSDISEGATDEKI